jgi:hypothetical protein
MAYTRREANEATHLLAKMGLQVLDSRCWLEEFPSCVENIVMAK